MQKNEIISFLDKNYAVRNNVFIDKSSNKQEWGYEIVDVIKEVFSIGQEACKDEVKAWYKGFYLNDKAFERAFGTKQLKVTWNPELAMDLQAYGVTSPNRQIISLMIQEIGKEVDVTILREIEPNLTTAEDLIGIMGCLGYKVGPTTYNEQTFMPVRHWWTIKDEERDNERQNNTIWQNWVRTRQQNEETRITS